MPKIKALRNFACAAASGAVGEVVEVSAELAELLINHDPPAAELLDQPAVIAEVKPTDVGSNVPSSPQGTAPTSEDTKPVAPIPKKPIGLKASGKK